jgi:hypothetical protein
MKDTSPFCVSTDELSRGEKRITCEQKMVANSRLCHGVRVPAFSPGPRRRPHWPVADFVLRTCPLSS